MILISVKKLVTFIVLIVLSTVFLVFMSINIFVTESVNISFSGQNIIFWGIIVLIFQLFLFYNLYHSHNKVIKNIRRISDIGELSHPKVVKIITEMGSLGHELDSLLKNQNEIIELRARRISTLNILVKTLSSGYNRAILVTDINGMIISISNLLKEKFEKENRSDDLKTDLIIDIVPNLPLKSIVYFIETEKKEWTDEKFKGIKCYPVLNSENNVTFCIWEFDSIDKTSFKVAENVAGHKRPINNFLNRLIKRK